MLIYADADGKFRVPTRCKIVRFILGRWPEPDAMEIKPVVRVKAGRRTISDDDHLLLSSQWTANEIERRSYRQIFTGLMGRFE